MFWSLLCLIFAPAVDRTGANLFAVREQASATLAAWWPLSEPALAVGRESTDPEVRRRCEVATPKDVLADLVALQLLCHRNERDGLPLADLQYAPQWATWADSLGIVHVEDRMPWGVPPWKVRDAVGRIARAHGIDTSASYYFGPNEFWQAPTGYDFVRLRMRGVAVGGCHDWSDAGRARMRQEWAALKGK